MLYWNLIPILVNRVVGIPWSKRAHTFTYPKARAVIAQEMMAEEAAVARLSLRQARRWVKPISTEHSPIAPAISANINIKLVDGFPPKSKHVYFY